MVAPIPGVQGTLAPAVELDRREATRSRQHARMTAERPARLSDSSCSKAHHLHALTTGAAPTPRELEVVRLVAAARSNDEIANRLSVSPKTVEAYLTRMFERWGVVTRTELALLAEREGWLDL